MISKKPRRTMEFCNNDKDFIKHFAGDIGCHYSQANERTFNLNRFESDNQGEKGIFAWIHKEDKYLWVATRKVWIEQAKAEALANRKTFEFNCFSRDSEHAEDSVYFNINDDYEKTVKVLSLINKSNLTKPKSNLCVAGLNLI
jgi:hypothetical protein